jgi:hypothetical protein
MLEVSRPVALFQHGLSVLIIPMAIPGVLLSDTHFAAIASTARQELVLNTR